MIKITEESLALLREKIEPYLPNRMRHTLGVEREAARLGEIYLPEKVMELRIAALLHDITKRRSVEEHREIFQRHGYVPNEMMFSSPKVLHAISASFLAKDDFSEYINDEILSGIRWHTTGRKGMSLFESIIYLADYIEDTRTFEDCVVLRSYFYDHYQKNDSMENKVLLLEKTMVQSFDMTIRCLLTEQGCIDQDTVEARNDFVLRLRRKEVQA